MSENHKRREEDENYRPRYPEMQKKYEETSQRERNRDRQVTGKEIKEQSGTDQKIAYNILRTAMLYGDRAELMTEAMDDFSDDPLLRKKYVFSGIDSFY